MDIVQLLLDYGADITMTDALGNGALMYAAGVANLLLNSGIGVQLRNQRGQTALHWAASILSKSTELLLNHKANATIKDETGCNACCIIWAHSHRKTLSRGCVSLSLDINDTNNH